MAGRGLTLGALRLRTSGDDPMIGHHVEICTRGGVAFRGIVKAIECTGDLAGELFDLESYEHPGYEHFVYVTDRRAQVRELAFRAGG